MARYEPLAHTADAGIVAYGASAAELFGNAAYGMFDLMFDLAALTADRWFDVSVSGESVEELLMAWLGELLFVSERDEVACCEFTVTELTVAVLRATVGGTSHREVELRGAPVKAVTWHDLEVTAVGPTWTARIVFDV